VTFSGLQTLATLLAVIPFVGILGHYVFRVRWWESETGKALFYLLVVAVLGLGISACVRAFPEAFASEAGQWVRISVRLAVFVVGALLWRAMIHVRREGEVAAEPESADEVA
jgi:protein-S-isoprenylcysteine O-methyltransferase Ste14